MKHLITKVCGVDSNDEAFDQGLMEPVTSHAWIATLQARSYMDIPYAQQSPPITVPSLQSGKKQMMNVTLGSLWGGRRWNGIINAQHTSYHLSASAYMCVYTTVHLIGGTEQEP